MSVQARLEVKYKSNKASNRSYFPFCNKVFKGKFYLIKENKLMLVKRDKYNYR